MIIDKVWRKRPRREPQMAYGRVPSPWLVRLKGEKITRRVYEDWNQLDKRGSDSPRKWAPVPLVLVIKGAVVTLTDDQRKTVKDA